MTQFLANMNEQAMDVTAHVDFAANDDESLPLTKCVCEAKFWAWEEMLGVYPDHPWTCPQCGAKLYFSVGIRVFQVQPP